MKITIGDVAQRANVSKTTVSRIVNGNYSHTTEETRKRVMAAIEELDYRPNALAKGLKSMKTNVIGIVLSNLKNPFWITALEGVEDTCYELGYNLMICNTNEEPEKEEEYIREFEMRQVDGIVINPTVRNYNLYEKLIDSIPMVVINRRIPGLATHNVVFNNVKGGFLAVNHLFNNNRKNIAVLAFNNPFVSTWRDRLEGYQSAILAKGLSTSDFKELKLEQSNKDVKTQIVNYLSQNRDIDAIFSTNNMITLEVLSALKEMNLKVPEDIAIVSYDETVWAKHLNSPLTTIRQPGYQMGKIAAQNLIESIQEGRKPKPRTIELEPELIIRDSSGSLIKK
ncbi:LacI family DNA-binding transcriptional regulator [Evansella tamaricis]|uniref:LacI family transcriptional regulator n=1 Tax=Evansella tamaricis TaxID=2069301 RepID=A0ABS6JFE2_9BACI|nr:LacI family DNA-binding transcriptional regulator [Evansella tamaricis]MBU9711185.1 LacI family transcriptional regulator [Evansella tamaricis]